MASPNFAALLSKPAGEAKRPSLLPEGTYYGTINNYKLDEKNRKDGTKEPYVKFQGVLTHAHDDVVLVDEDDKPIEVSGRKFPGIFSGEFSFTDEYLYLLDNFIKGFGIEMEGRGYGEILPQLVGQSVQLQVTQRPYQDKEGNTLMANDSTRMSAVPA